MKNFLFSLFAMLMICVSSQAQTIKVNGTVMDPSFNESVIGAKVMEVGTQNGTITNMDGKFTLTVKKGAKISISCVGYATQELEAKEEMYIEMGEDSKLMQEMVVTGYQVQRKADLTGAVGVVNVNDLKTVNENNPIKALQGRVPGMNISADGSPSGAATVRIRGIGTLNDNDPLYIIDGVPTKAGMHELNGNDIESIQVLKDAASASIYGARAANGVIIITTKKGKDGVLKVDFDATASASFYANRTKTLNAYQFGEAFWRANMNDLIYGTGTPIDPNKNNLGYHFDWKYDANGTPVLNSISMNPYLDPECTVRAGDTDWFDQVTRTGSIQNYNVSISNGTEKGSSFFSFGYFNNNGTIKTTNFERFSGRANTEYKFFNGALTVGENLTMNYTDGVDAPGNIISNALQFNPNYPIYAENGEYAQTLGAYSERENPVSILHNTQDNRYYMWRTFGDIHVNLNPFKGLNIRSTIGLDYSQKKQNFYTYPIANGKVERPADKSAVERKQEHWMRWMWNAVASYNHEIKEHRFDVMAGMEVNRQNYDWLSAKRYGYDIFNTDYMWPNSGAGEQEAKGSADGFSLVSFFGKANYSYDDRYLASFTIRRDGSSRFGNNNKWGNFPSLSAGWRITEEKFVKDKNLNWLDDLKLRYSWGMTGNSEISNTARYTLYQKQVSTGLWGSGAAGTVYDITGSNGGYNLNSGYIRTQMGNEDIKWETTTQHNIGLDFAFFRQDLYGSIDWYDKQTSDILVLMDGYAAMGEGAVQWTNAGSMQNRGFEFSLGYRHKLKDFSWDINGNIGTYRNKITKLPETVAAKGTFGGNGVMSVVGRAMGSQVGYIYDGIFKSQEEIDNHANQEGAALGRIRYKDINGYDENGNLTGKPDGKITEADRDWIFDPTPAFTWGLNVYLQYKNWDLTMFWQGVAGVDVITYDTKCQTDFWVTQKNGANLNYLNKGDRVLDAWTPSNNDSNIPALTTVDRNHESDMSSYYVENGSYGKLRTLQIGYNAPEKFVEKLHLSRVRAYVSGQNLLTLKSNKFSGVDPENPGGFNYPIPMNFTFGVNVSF